MRSLSDLIRRHVRQEESEMFPRLRQIMHRHRQGTVSGQIRREEAMVQ